MKQGYVVEENLQRAAARWRWLRFLHYSALVGVAACAAVVLMGLAFLLGWTPGPTAARTLLTLVLLGGFVGWLILAVSIFSDAPKRPWLAATLERGQPQLLDRLNTMVFLEGQAKRNPGIRAFYLRIARQAQSVLSARRAAIPISAGRTWRRLAALAAVLAATVWFYEHYTPWERMLAAYQQKLALKRQPPPPPEAPPEVLLPEQVVTEPKQSWGEVRITEPARDLQVTKADVVPLQIEAAASEPLQQVSWSSAINGQNETRRPLPPPSEPRYAVYQPTLKLDEWPLADWDVLTYHARASAGSSNSFASEVYFLEVRPFREDLLKLPGGEDGKAYQCLSELTSLIEQQQHVIRQTHRHVQQPPTETQLRAQDRQKLAEAEQDLGRSVEHLQARMAAELEGRPIAESLGSLRRAETNLTRAGEALVSDAMPEAQNRERGALADLIAARKLFQRAITDHPDAFHEPKPEEPPPLAQDARRLKEIAEFRDAARAAEQFVEKAVQQQREIARQAAARPSSVHPELARQENQLRQSLEEFERQQPQPFRDLQSECRNAQEGLGKAADALQKRSATARNAAQGATQKLEQLRDALRQQNAGGQLADAYRLKEMLDRQIETFGQCQQSPGGLSNEAVQGTAREARETLRQLRAAAGQSPTREAFGPELREALTEERLTEADWPLSQLEKPLLPQAKQQAAGQAKECLSRVSQAFDASQPKGLQAAARSDALKPGTDQSFGLGLAQLESLLRQLQNPKPPSPEDQTKQGAEALYNLQTGLRNRHGSNERVQQLLADLERALKPEQRFDLEDLTRLQQQLQSFSVELTPRGRTEDAKPEVSSLDPNRLPPAYRSRIEKYFQRLSEK